MHRISLYTIRTCTITLWLFLLCANRSSSQVISPTLHFDQLTIKDGLSHNGIQCLLQDHNGYIWIGTQNGLNKYDGYDFEIYKSSGLDTTEVGFLGKTITALYQDSKQNLWVGTEKSGINHRSKQSGEFINLQLDTAFAAIRGYKISSIYEDRDHDIWIATIGGGILEFNPETKQSRHYNQSNSGLSNNLVFDIVQDNEGVIWVGTSGVGINYMDDGEHFELLSTTLPDKSNMAGYRKTLYLDDKYLWLGTEGSGLYRITLIDKTTKRYSTEESNSISSNTILDIHKTKGDKLYITTDGTGLNVLDLTTQQISYYDHQNNDIQALNSNSLVNLMEDRSGNIWIGTYNGGLNIYKPNKTWFDLIFPPYTIGEQLKNRSILSIEQGENGSIYIGTDGGGLNYMTSDPDKTDIINYKTGSSNSISGNVVKSIYKDKENQIWLGIFSENTSIYNHKTKQFKDFPEARSVWTIDGNSKKEICLGTIGDGLKLYDKNNQKTISYQHNPNDNTTIGSNLIMSVVYDDNDQLWIGTADSGLDLYFPATETFLHHQHIPTDSTSLSSNEVRAVYQDAKGEMWVGTEGGGLNKWLGEGRFERIGKDQGLIANSVMGICEDNDGMIWVTTFIGISKYDPITKHIQNFDFRTSQNLNQFNQMAILSLGDDRLYFGGTNGLHLIRPEEVKQQSAEVSVLFTDLEVSNKKITAGPQENGQAILAQPIETEPIIHLTYIDNSFSISFSAIDFTNLNENVYQYMMEGFDDSWLITKPNQHSVSYTNLDPGNYVFRVKYRDNESFKSIIINPPFWQTFLFKFALILFILSILGGSLLFLLRRRDAIYKRQMLRLEKEKLETSIEAKNSKLMFFAIQMAHKNEVLSNFKTELQEASDSKSNKTRKLINKIDRELKNENYWDDFNVYFNRVDQHFVKSIQGDFPALTSNDIRMCSLVRMNLSNKEIASLCNISSRGVEQSKYRLKKRLDLDKNEDLTRFISLYQSQKLDSRI